MMGAAGFTVFDTDPGVSEWATAAFEQMKTLAQDPDLKSKNLRHGQTWFVGVDILPNAPDGNIGGVPLLGQWRAHVPDIPLHRAQVSIVYPGYPRQDADESDANHRYRVHRAAAHVDGLLPVGPDRRRYAQEFHAYILALPLNPVAASPTLVWRGSHTIMQTALARAIGGHDPAAVDITDAYHAARRVVFETCEALPLTIKPGQAALIHRFALHGTAPWDDEIAGPDGRMVAFFRPEFSNPHDWVNLP